LTIKIKFVVNTVTSLRYAVSNGVVACFKLQNFVTFVYL